MVRQIPERLQEKLKLLDKINVDLRYQKLENLLQNQDFLAADQETYRVMCEVIGEEVGYWFEPDDLRIFSCPNLKKN